MDGTHSFQARNRANCFSNTGRAKIAEAGRRRHGAFAVWNCVVAFLLLQAVGVGAGTVTNNTFAELQAAMQNGTNVVFLTNGTITFTEPIVVTNNTVLTAGSNIITLSGNGSTRLFEVRSNVSFTISRLILTRGFVGGTDGSNGVDGSDRLNSGGNGSSGGAGGNVSGGAILNSGSLTLIQCQLITNAAAGGFGGDGGNGGSGDFEGGNGGNGGAGGWAFGGAIYNIGSLLMTNCTLSGNFAVGGDGGVGGGGGDGGLPGYAGGGAAGAAGAGGCIYNLGEAKIFNCTFSGNIALGGYSTKAGSSSGFANGRDGAAGGSGLGGGIYSTGIVTIVNSTFASNAVEGGLGGDGGDGDFEGGDGGNGGLGSGGGVFSVLVAAVTNCTFSGNSATGGTNGVAGSGGISGSNGSMGASRGGNIARNAGSFILANSILNAAATGGNGYGTITDAGFNISSDNSVNFTAAGSLKNTNSNLGALGDNGGATLTFMPQVGSPAIDRGSAGGCLLIDQRGVARPAGGTCDAGAVETSGLTIQTPPQSQTVAVGASVTFDVVATGELPLTYHWRFNSNNIAGATNVQLILSNAQLTNAGNYFVVVSNVTGSVTNSVAATLKVLLSTTLQSPSLANQTNFAFSYLTRTGQSYVVQFKSDLSQSNWIILKTNAGTGNVLNMIQPITGMTGGFFRLLIQ